MATCKNIVFVISALCLSQTTPTLASQAQLIISKLRAENSQLQAESSALRVKNNRLEHQVSLLEFRLRQAEIISQAKEMLAKIESAQLGPQDKQELARMAAATAFSSTHTNAYLLLQSQQSKLSQSPKK
jgi:hypothetical protein